MIFSINWIGTFVKLVTIEEFKPNSNILTLRKIKINSSFRFKSFKYTFFSKIGDKIIEPKITLLNNQIE